MSEKMSERTAKAERQPQPDLGNGTYRNPVLAGNHADASVVRVGGDYYLTHSGPGTPNALIWHSHDLVNWEPLAYALPDYIGDVWAPELIRYEGLFYLYLPLVQSRPDGGRVFKNVVCTAEDPAGPWSAPIDLHLDGYIDPGHVADDQGNRYLYVSGGVAAPLASDGLSLTGAPRPVYDGWSYPDTWIVECFCLESPKFIRRGDYVYLISAQGGTAGPATSHMSVVARATSPLGPWENSPYNPLIRTRSRAERWWSQGHSTLIDDVDGNWWQMYHAYEHGYRTLGRQTLLLPVRWTDDGWPVSDLSPEAILPKPAGDSVSHGIPLSDDFEVETLGLQWRNWDRDSGATVVRVGGGALHMDAHGDNPAGAALLACQPANHAFEVQVEITCPDTAEAGLLLGTGSQRAFAGAALRYGNPVAYSRGRPHPGAPFAGPHIYVKIRNLYHDVALYYSGDGETWHTFDRGSEVSCITGLSIALYAAGEGEVTFQHFRYLGLD